MKKDEYLHEVNRSISYTPEEWFFTEIPDDLQDTVTLTEKFLESGGIAFGNPVFEKEIFSVFGNWTYDDKFLKIELYAQSLLENLPEDSWNNLREKLQDYATGQWLKHEDVSRSPWPGLPEEYLKNWNWQMFEFATKVWNEKKAIKEARMDLIFSEKYPD